MARIADKVDRAAEFRDRLGAVSGQLFSQEGGGAFRNRRVSVFQQALTIQGVDPEPGPPEAVGERIKADIVKWKDVVATAKITGTQ